tara:strand:- start:42762 stop:43082 length:321 start_codon:yes stop_codon:yes gene_type:complete
VETEELSRFPSRPTKKAQKNKRRSREASSSDKSVKQKWSVSTTTLPRSNRTAQRGASLALLGFEARISLVDHVNATTATDHFAIPVALFEGFKGRLNFHGFSAVVW